MISTKEASEAILSRSRNWGMETVPFELTGGRFLAEEIQIDRDMPPFDRVMMDGIAIRHADFENGIREFRIHGRQFAGSPREVLMEGNTCMEVMTGAMLPEGADTVVRYEDITEKEGIAVIRIDKLKRGLNIHLKGFDRKAGEVVLKSGRRIGAREIAILASAGKTEVRVHRQPRIAIISTGDELVEVGEDPAPYQIRTSNGHMVGRSLLEEGFSFNRFHLLDEMDVMISELENILEDHDVFLFSGGVSRGKKDFVPDVLEQCGIEKIFHKVAQRPGKPFWFGVNGEKTVFALPGNPVSTFLCFRKYVVPWLKSCMGIQENEQNAVLAEDFTFLPDLTCFLQVRLTPDESGRKIATPVPGHGSGDFANLVDTDAFIEIPRGREEFKRGEVFPLVAFD